MTASSRLPDFIIAGAAKSATTWLQHSLQQSPRVSMPNHEPHFFSRRYEEGMEAYLAELGPAPDAVLLGEKSNSYLTMPDAAARIHRHIPDVRLIFQLRDPVARAYSDYLMLFRRGEVDGDINRHLDPDRAANGRFLSDGRYADHLQRFFDLFHREQILVLRYEDIAAQPQRQLKRFSEHLGLAEQLAPPIEGRVKDASSARVPRSLRRILTPLRPVLDPIRHTRVIDTLRSAVARPEKYPPFDPALRADLAEFYAPQISDLRKLTGLDFAAWGSA
ncbi:sulfotransferase [Paracoccus sediminicola]|uniref:sulfotransferase n=1 Tax=Paracoccus sediminicola TaxID=3017783 RepID=UPI0022EFE84B|nr:sulfotransferase [Paracoccus sediminicola]WBU56497.1 sulfotransferase [Paracoccus sediminicola]